MIKSTLPRALRSICWGLVVSLLTPAVLHAQPPQAPPQDDQVLAPVSRTYAITNVNIIQGPGRKIDMGTVLIKDGLITAAGKGLAVPPEAVVIKADSMYVYAGFIDGLARTGVTKPKEETQPRVQNPGNPPPDRAGITPQTDVRNLLNSTDKALEDFRGVGFTTAQVVPHGVLLPGSAAVIQLNGKPADEIVLVTKSSFYSELTSNQGVYPGTILGIMAKWRELYTQADLARGYESMYASNRAGLERPASNRILEAFYPVIEKKQPVLFKADKILDAHRVLTLQHDLGFNLTIANLKEGWDVINKIKAANAKVFLSLELPDEVKEEKKDAKKDAKPETANDKEKAALEARKKDFIAKYDGQAATFAKAGVKFGFASIDVKTSSVQANLRRMIKAGLTEDQALAALTTSPAEILGVSDRLGSIDNGKIANLTISDKPYFNEKAKVRWVFIDGQPFKMEAKEAKKDNGGKAEIVGTWSVTTETPQGKNNSTVTFTKDGNSYTGKVSGGMIQTPIEVKKVELDGTSLKYSYSFTMGGSQTINVEVDATVDGETYSGTASVGAFGSFPLEAKKDPK